MKWFKAKGEVASRLRQRKHKLLRRFHIPPDALGGCLSLTHRRCGKPTCHCATAARGHPTWSLSFALDGERRVERVPDDWVDEIRPLLQEGREYKAAVVEVFAINAELLALWRKEQTKKRKKKQ